MPCGVLKQRNQDCKPSQLERRNLRNALRGTEAMHLDGHNPREAHCRNLRNALRGTEAYIGTVCKRALDDPGRNLRNALRGTEAYLVVKVLGGSSRRRNLRNALRGTEARYGADTGRGLNGPSRNLRNALRGTEANYRAVRNVGNVKSKSEECPAGY